MKKLFVWSIVLSIILIISSNAFSEQYIPGIEKEIADFCMDKILPDDPGKNSLSYTVEVNQCIQNQINSAFTLMYVYENTVKKIENTKIKDSLTYLFNICYLNNTKDDITDFVETRLCIEEILREFSDRVEKEKKVRKYKHGY